MTDHRPRPRKQPIQERAQATVAALVEAAARILEENGRAGFSTNAVAERAGVSIGSLYQYFPSKEALLSALIVRETNLLIAEAKTALDEPTGRAALTRLIRACVAHQLRRPALARLLDFEEAVLPRDIETARVAEEFRQIGLSLFSRPDLTSQEPPLVVTQDVMAIIKGMIDAAGERGETIQIDLAARVERAVLGYLTYS
ncbi:TetR/AcrR family transcriptional regulator [Jiella pacifica]|uniref:TetR family transcriptional regulator n=1 Tax=Jiella pacifica TaxID=2696469 RepID=A0A6N9SWL8_9HYPH|nr:TetR/AcrR family transcriptional regulator [Jiella pacifica]NDW03414.1 TetR family transcriptional regulator [Jiella pacifica]